MNALNPIACKYLMLSTTEKPTWSLYSNWPWGQQWSLRLKNTFLGGYRLKNQISLPLKKKKIKVTSIGCVGHVSSVRTAASREIRKLSTQPVSGRVSLVPTESAGRAIFLTSFSHPKECRGRSSTPVTVPQGHSCLCVDLVGDHQALGWAPLFSVPPHIIGHC